MSDTTGIDVRALADKLELDQGEFERACVLAHANGSIGQGDKWNVVDDLVSAIWFSDVVEGDITKIDLQCELFDLAPAYSTGMYLAGSFRRIESEAKRRFWSWALAHLREGSGPISGPLVYFVAVDFDEDEIPEEFLTLVEQTDWDRWGVGTEWPSFAREQALARPKSTDPDSRSK